jgi:hypothetical protein
VEEYATTADLLKASLSAVRRAPLADLQAIRESGLRWPPLPASNAYAKYAVCRAMMVHFLTENVMPPSIHAVADEPGRTTTQQ